MQVARFCAPLFSLNPCSGDPMILSTALFLSAQILAMPTVAVDAAAPQDVRTPAGRGGPQPGGSIPEPATMLLLAGGALGYGAFRLKRSRNGTNSSTEGEGRKEG